MPVQDLAYLDGQVGQVAAVQAHAVSAGIVVVDAALLEGADGVEDAAFKGIVSVDQQDEVLSPMGTDVVQEGLVLAFDGTAVGGDEAMGHGAGGGHAVHDPRKDVGGAGTAGDDGGFGAVSGGPGTMGAAGTELAYRPLRGPADPGSLGGHGHLVVHDAQHGRFQNLRFDKRGFHRNDGLVGEDDFAFAHGIEIPRKLHAGEVFPEFAVGFARQELLIEALRLGAQSRYHFDDFLRAADHRPVVVFRSFAVKEVEDGGLSCPSGLVKRLSHGVLVLV